MSDRYTVYMHTCPNGKRYIGITRLPVEVRWRKGRGYKAQSFGAVIAQYGWENIRHEVLMSNLSRAEATRCEKLFIAMFRTVEPEYGYNRESGGKIAMSKAEHSAFMKNTQSVTNLDTEEVFCNVREAAAAYRAFSVAIYECCVGVRETAAGYHWAYLD